jgi:hypothetical protein
MNYIRIEQQLSINVLEILLEFRGFKCHLTALHSIEETRDDRKKWPVNRSPNSYLLNLLFISQP